MTLERRKEELERIEEYTERFRSRGNVPLLSLKQGIYTVLAAKRQTTRFGPSYKLLVEDGDSTFIVWSNKSIADVFEEKPEEELEKLVNIDGDDHLCYHVTTYVTMLPLVTTYVLLRHCN